MSFSLGISGHVGDADTAEQVDEVVRTKGREIVAALAELGVTPDRADFSGPSGHENYLAAPVEDAPDSGS